MKQYLLLLIVFLSFCSANAQVWGVPNLTTFDDRKIHFGFTLGLNVMDLGFSHYNTLDDNPEFDASEVSSLNSDYLLELDSVGRMVRADVAQLTPGFTVGIVTNLRLTENLDLRFLPGLSFGNRKVVYNVPIHDLNESDNVDSYSLRATYLDFPLLVKYKSKRIINQRPYVIGGMAVRYDISKSASEELLRMKKTSVYAEAGIGWDTYLQFFRFSTELKYSIGLNNSLAEAPDDPQPKYFNLAFKNLSSHIFTLSFHFE
jgi:hypothetical protein